jgi:hypothetical protein
MRKWFSKIGGLSLVTLLAVVFTLQVAAQKKETKAPKLSNVQGTVANMDKSKMTITVKNGGTQRDVIYSADTKFLFGHSKDNKPGSVDQVKENYFISCAGTFPSGKVQLTATECVYRETK